MIYIIKDLKAYLQVTNFIKLQRRFGVYSFIRLQTIQQTDTVWGNIQNYSYERNYSPLK
jgi:hypothetical protein